MQVQVGDCVMKGLKLDAHAGDLYSQTSKIFYLFSEDTRGVVKATPLSRRKSSRNAAKQLESIIYEVDSIGLEKIKKSVYIPDAYIPKRPRLIRE
jgi:hypothetical protein